MEEDKFKLLTILLVELVIIGFIILVVTIA